MNADFIDTNILVYLFSDALMVASALEEGCQNLYTEDFQHGQVVDDNLTIVNPFLSE